MKIIAIDPDCEASGVGVIEDKELTFVKATFSELIFNEIPMDAKIVIEGGWLNKKTNFHDITKGERVASSIGHRVGRNHQTGILLAECLKRLGHDVTIVKPFRKVWKKGKISHDELVEFSKSAGFTINKKRSNQDERDAMLIAIIFYKNHSFSLHK